MDKAAYKLGKTGERMVPGLHKGLLIYTEHLMRYLAAQEIVRGKIVLDIASGSGYGTEILAETAKHAYGVDVDAASIEYAKQRYKKSNVEYIVGNGEKIPLESESVDVVVSFETIEHIRDYKKFLAEVKRVLRPAGIAIISTPNDLEFAEGNHYHLHEFTYQELLGLLKKDFKFIDSYYQATWKAVAIGSQEDLMKEGQLDVPLLSYSAPKPQQFLYFYLVCSNQAIKTKIRPQVSLGEHYSDRAIIGMQMTNEKNIEDYRKLLEQVRGENAQLRNELEQLHQSINQSKVYQIAMKAENAKKRLSDRLRGKN